MKNSYTVNLKPSYSNQFFSYQIALQSSLLRGFLLVGMLLITTLLTAQTWERFFDISSHDFSKSIHQAADGDVLVLANVGNGTDASDVYLLKMNADGDSLWSKTFGGSSYDEAEQLIFTSDGNYLILGYSFSFGNNGQFYLIKIDTAGNLIWERNYGGIGFDRGRTLVETTDGDFVLAGWTRSPMGGDISQICELEGRKKMSFTE